MAEPVDSGLPIALIDSEHALLDPLITARLHQSRARVIAKVDGVSAMGSLRGESRFAHSQERTHNGPSEF